MFLSVGKHANRRRTMKTTVFANGERLQLSTDGPQRLNGVLKTATMTWRRAQPN
jgi:hypothetical protein